MNLLLVGLAIAIVWMLHHPLKTLLIFSLIYVIGSCGHALDEQENASAQADAQVTTVGMSSMVTNIWNPNFDSNSTIPGLRVHVLISNPTDKKLDSFTLRCSYLDGHDAIKFDLEDDQGIGQHTKIMRKYTLRDVPEWVAGVNGEYSTTYNTKCIFIKAA